MQSLSEMGWQVMDLGSAHGSFTAGNADNEQQHCSNLTSPPTAPLELPPNNGLPRLKIPKLEQVQLCDGQRVVFGASKRIYTLRIGKRTNSGGLNTPGFNYEDSQRTTEKPSQGGDGGEPKAMPIETTDVNRSGIKRKRLVTFVEENSAGPSAGSHSTPCSSA